MAQDAATACPTRALGSRGAPNTTRRPLAWSTTQRCSRPSNAAPQRSTRRAKPAMDTRPSGSAASHPARMKAPMGAKAPSPDGTGRLDSAPRFAQASRGGAAVASETLGDPATGGRGRRPAARRAATIEPALVPTQARHRVASTSPVASKPASTPVIHATPRSPPPPRTRMSGVIAANRRSVPRIDHRQDRAGLHLGPFRDTEFRHRSGRRRNDLVLHLHGLDDHEGLSGYDLGARIDHHADDGAGHRRAERAG